MHDLITLDQWQAGIHPPLPSFSHPHTLEAVERTIHFVQFPDDSALEALADIFSHFSWSDRQLRNSQLAEYSKFVAESGLAESFYRSFKHLLLS